MDSEKTQRHLSKISQINMLLAVFALIGVCVLYLWFRWGVDDGVAVSNANTVSNSNRITNRASTVQNTNTVPTPEDVKKLTEEYQDAINALLDSEDLSDTNRAKELSNAAVALRVPADLRSMHVQIIAALDEAARGESDAANERITELKTSYSWFLP